MRNCQLLKNSSPALCYFVVHSGWDPSGIAALGVARLLELGGSNPTGGMDVCLLWVLCVEVSASSWSPVQRSLTECGVPESDLEASMWRGPWPIGALAPWIRLRQDESASSLWSVFAGRSFWEANSRPSTQQNYLTYGTQRSQDFSPLQRIALQG
jgi:hypothetical protein